jgi:hypothetical protein
MTANELLLWLSARNQGSWAQFRAATENLDLAEAESEGGDEGPLPLHQRIRYNLERLGHVEFDAEGCSDGWRIAPPALALCHHGSEAVGVLCGARTRQLLVNIKRESKGLQQEQLSDPDCPDIIRLRAGDTELLMKLAQRAGTRFQADAPVALLSRLPQIDRMEAWKREPMPSSGKDWDIKHLVIHKRMMKWQAVSLSEANAGGAEGLFRFTRFQTPQYFLREGRQTFALPGAAGKYYVLHRRKRNILRYCRKEQTLSVPAIFRPPLLAERALVLCSGLPPSVSEVHGRHRLTYQLFPKRLLGWPLKF